MDDVSLWVWAVTIVGIGALLAFDYFFHVRKAHFPTIREAAVWSAIYVAIAILFGFLVVWFGDLDMGIEYFSGYITEKALSVDNLFVFLIIIASFRVPREDQQKVLLFGIIFALFARSAFIALGKAMIENLTWAFYLFGALLIWTAIHLLLPDNDDDEANNFVIRFAKKHLRTSERYDGDKLFTFDNGKRVLTPMLLVMVAIGGTDVLFAIDSVPAIYGLTTNVYVVFTATAFSLMGLRQLYFLIDDLLDRLIYLKYGLSLILGFIGVKLVFEALHSNELPFINGGEPVAVPEITVGLSLIVIVVILTVTIVVSLLSPQGKIESAAKSLDRLVHEYLSRDIEPQPGEQAALYERIVSYETKLSEMDSVRVEDTLSRLEVNELLTQVHAQARGGH